MEDRRATGIAMAVGAAAVGGLWLARPSAARATLSVVDQWIPVAANGPDADAAAFFRLRLGGAARSALEEGQRIEFRLVGRSGRGFVLVPADSPRQDLYKLRLGYALPPTASRIVAMLDGSVIGSAPVADLPRPRGIELRPSAAPPLTFLVSPDEGLRVATNRAIPKGERWIVAIRRTPYGPVDAVFGIDASGVRDFRRATIPYASQAGFAEIDVERLRMVPRSEVIEVAGMRLAERFGGAALVVDRPLRLTTRLGMDLHLPRQDNGPRHPVRSGNGRTAWVSLTARDLRKKSGPGRRFGVRFEILSPKPETLGLRALRVGNGILSAEAPPRGPVATGPIVLRLRVTRVDPVPVGTSRYVVPVRPAARDDGFAVVGALGAF